MNKIFFKDLEIEHICKPSLKNSYIRVNKDAKVVLKTPKVTQRYINNLLEKKELWIRDALLKTTANRPQSVNLEDEVMLFGDVYSIDINEAKELRELLNRLRVNNEKNILRCYDDFYKLYAKKYLTQRVEYFSKLMGLDYSDIRFRKMKSRWGSCSSKKVITLNSELIKIKKELIDYVVVHELAHITHMNHSKSFHDLVERYIFNSKKIRKELKSISL
jgi:predicted metal-dependent hydrolase